MSAHRTSAVTSRLASVAFVGAVVVGGMAASGAHWQADPVTVAGAHWQSGQPAPAGAHWQVAPVSVDGAHWQ